MIDPTAEGQGVSPRNAEGAIGEDTVDVRSGPEIHQAVLSLLPLLGLWRGEGQGDYPTMDGFAYGQEIRFFHDGRPFLGMESKTWILDAEGKPARLANREVGWWRPGEGDDFDVVLTDSSGVVEVYVGHARTTTSWELTSDLVARIPSVPDITANHRLYGVVEGDLMYAIDMAAMGQPMQPHISARLKRIV